ncbi:ATP-binding protein [Hyphomicrobium sulfonivorans]|uniref:ATP-binding protein n=1 Tax=Hyphomicrobium sulfonivorans TaxID=121290 RepID=UPI001570398D|nr:ATP-binding protein [Hyphomicrobium sulfonivorans]MBI1648288.1 two-component sensor histidine kinase [Hyphomicrobium sulfonivorans]NSL71177.1 two-component sensor histidine kinase [Hyphomicrobium sulfonivorans]
MSIGSGFTSIRWAERRVEAEAWLRERWAAAKLRLAQRTMPVAAAAIIFMMLMLTGSLSGLAAIGGLASMLLAAAVWPLDWSGADAPGVEVPAIAGRRIGDGERSGWRAVIDAIPTAALALDANGDLLHHNRLAAEMFPKIRDGAPMSKISRSPDLLVAIDQLLVGSEDRIDVELVDRVPVERRLEATVSRLAPIDRASPPHVLVTFRDMTEEDRLGQMRSDFIANASHELRTPLASLRGFVETLQGPAREDANARERFLKLMAVQAERMTRLIDDLLSLSRVEMRAHLPPRGIAELNETASYVCQSLEPIAEAQRATVVLVSDVETARIRGDREEIVQVLQNLIQNAIKYGRSGGTIEVRVGREARPDASAARVWVSVTDEGHGIAAEHLPRLTERFYRVSAISSREKGGTGLGLAIVKHILNRHRADLRISSKIGVGSTFTASFEELGAGG